MPNLNDVRVPLVSRAFVLAQVRLDDSVDLDLVRTARMAARWYGRPDYPVEMAGNKEVVPRRIVERLAECQDVPLTQLHFAADWCNDSAAWYATVEPPMPAYAAAWAEASEDCRLAGRMIQWLAGSAAAQIPSIIKFDGWDDRT